MLLIQSNKHCVWFLFTSGIQRKIILAVKMYVTWIIFWAQKLRKKLKQLEEEKNLFFRKCESYETLLVTFSWNLYSHYILTVTTPVAYYFTRMYLFYITFQDRWLEQDLVQNRSEHSPIYKCYTNSQEIKCTTCKRQRKQMLSTASQVFRHISIAP
jgi:hypothetical protein